MTKEENITSWKSAMRGLFILGKANEELWLDLSEPREKIEIEKDEKKYIKKAIKFAKKLL
jgi:hypothetical protein